ncbi:nuclear transport factor 2 family protein [Myxococcota bacterium]|nr:nuclear transport factor 2 family protein [Myxococcota bacterium]
MTTENESLREELASLKKQVRELEDREAVRQLTAEYMQAMHDARWEDAVACFSEQASYDHGLLGELRGKQDLRHFYTQFMPAFEEAGGWAFDLLADPVIQVDGDRAHGRWFLLTLLIDPDTQEAAWSMATLEYEYAREAEGWKFFRNRCIHEHMLAPYDAGWGAAGGSRLPDAAIQNPDAHFETLRRQGGKQRPGTLSRSIRGWTVPTLEPEPTS